MIENKTFPIDQLEAGETYRNCRWLPSAKGVSFSDIVFEHCEFEEQRFTHSEWLDCIFKNSVLSNQDFSASVFYRCVFEHCQLLGTNFSTNRWKETRVVDSRGDYLNFSESIIEKNSFEQIFKRSFFPISKH